VKNSKCKKHGNKFAEPLKLFSLYIFIVGDRMLYELLHANLKNILPSITTINKCLDKESNISDGIVRFKELKLFLTKRKYPLNVFISEDQTAILKNITYDSKSACRRALTMLPVPTPPEAEENLVRLIKSKLQGHAYLVIEDEQVATIETLCEILKEAFLSNRSTNYYRGELHNLYKKPSEHVLDYISRTKDLRQAILDVEARTYGNRHTIADRDRIDREVMDSFINSPRLIE